MAQVWRGLGFRISSRGWPALPAGPARGRGGGSGALCCATAARREPLREDRKAAHEPNLRRGRRCSPGAGAAYVGKEGSTVRILTGAALLPWEPGSLGTPRPSFGAGGRAVELAGRGRAPRATLRPILGGARPLRPRRETGTAGRRVVTRAERGVGTRLQVGSRRGWQASCAGPPGVTHGELTRGRAVDFVALSASLRLAANLGESMPANNFASAQEST